VLTGLWLVLAWANGMYDLRQAPDRWPESGLTLPSSPVTMILRKYTNVLNPGLQLWI
jgi:hypothetical protein